jgi:pimeloyl-ACP methyl ester carboxylesterase
MQFASGFEDGLADFRQVRRGYANDVRSWTREDVLSTDSVRCPTLLLHDPQDPAAPFCHAEYAAAKIPGAEIVELNTGGHLIWYGPDANRMHDRRTAFLREHSKH